MDRSWAPAGVEIRRSQRRRRSVSATREDGRTVVVVPARMPERDVRRYVEELVARLDRRSARAARGDGELAARAAVLAKRYLPEAPRPASVRWVSTMHRRWGSCTPLDATIRLSDRLQPMPEYVVDYVLLHELAHLVEPGHGAAFQSLVSRFPGTERARAFLDGVAHADAHGRRPASADDAAGVTGDARDRSGPRADPQLSGRAASRPPAATSDRWDALGLWEIGTAP
ncbi:MAG: M48 family peptidase [Actinomycetota bacterium]|nr:MAG: M48 family peptidase [Actinomycetota bacterium]